jgi:acyl homoserine lactone synthase
MLRYLYGRDLAKEPALADAMFRDRADQFARRLGWDVQVDHRGWERDQYDALDPLYVIWQGPDGGHQGSARFLPTTGRTMVNDHFLHLTDGVAFQSPLIWECTRFCLAPGAGRQIASRLMLGGAELMAAFGVDHFVGVFDQIMLRVYRGIGSVPDVLGTDGAGDARAISVGLWTYDAANHAALRDRAGISDRDCADWFDAAFGQLAEPLRMAS